MSDPVRAGRQEAVSELKRAMIVDAARRVFEKDGLEAASMRAIAREAGYTAGALYFHFQSKEAIYAVVLEISLDRLIRAVEEAVARAADAPCLGPGKDAGDQPARRLRAAGLAFFDFYAEHPRDFDLGFYLFRGGVRPQGLSAELDARLNRKLASSLAPVGDAASVLGADDTAARAASASVFGHAAGLLLLLHTGRIGMFGCDARALMDDYLQKLAAQLMQA